MLLALTRLEDTTAGELLRLCGVDAEEVFSLAVEYQMLGGYIPGKRNREVCDSKLLEQFS